MQPRTDLAMEAKALYERSAQEQTQLSGVAAREQERHGVRMTVVKITSAEGEQALAQRIDTLWRGVEWSWYRNGQNVLYWHWSPEYGWEMNFAVHGFNECLVMYILAAASPTYPIDREVYTEGWAENGAIVDEHEGEG